MTVANKTDFDRIVQAFIKRDFTPHFGRLLSQFRPDPEWNRLREIGTDLWLAQLSAPYFIQLLNIRRQHLLQFRPTLMKP